MSCLGAGGIAAKVRDMVTCWHDLKDTAIAKKRVSSPPKSSVEVEVISPLPIPWDEGVSA